MEKRLIVLAIQEEYLTIISQQIKEIAGDLIKIKSITVKDLVDDTVHKEDIVLLSGYFIKELVSPFIPAGVKYIVAKRAINIVNLKSLIDLPDGQNILVVNDNQINTTETVEMLSQTIFEHDYYPYNPEQALTDHVDYVVTPGEKHLVPKAFKKVINIGPRVLAIDTLHELFDAFDLQEHSSLLSKRYVKSLVSLSKVLVGEDEQASMGESVQNSVSGRFIDMTVKSERMVEVVHIAKKLAKTQYPIFISGEKGTGKRMLAEAIHNGSMINEKPFVIMNCKNRKDLFLEEELFGSGDKPGLLELAKGGTCFIKDICELPYPVQKRLAEYLEKDEFILKARLIFTSCHDLNSLIQQGEITNDLYYNLAPFSIHVPSLVDRKEDIQPLIEAFLKQISHGHIHFSQEVFDIFHLYHWPGNIRELYNFVSYCACLDESFITKTSLPLVLKGETKNQEPLNKSHEINVNELVRKIEEHGFLDESLAILQVFEEGKNRQESFGRNSLRERLKEKDIHLSDQQLRMRMEVLGELGLLLIRQGRAGTTISRNGSRFLEMIVFSEN